MLFSLTAFAAKENYDFLTAQYDSYESETVLTVKLNKPLRFFEAPEIEELKEGLGAYVDVKAFFESLFSEKETITAACKMNESKKGLKLSCLTEADSAIKFNKNLDVKINSRSGLWMDINVEDPENPVFDIITLPASEKYFHIGSDAILEDEDAKQEFVSVMTGVFDLISDKAATDAVKNFILEYADVKASNGVYIVKYDNESLIKILTAYSELMGIELPISELPVNLGIETKYILNASGQIKETNSAVNITCNLFDLFGADERDGAEWEKGNLDITVFADSVYKNINRVNKIEFPVLTDENSVEWYDLTDSESYWDYYYWSGQTDDIIYQNEKYYFPLETLTEQNLTPRRYKFSYSGDKVTFENPSHYGTFVFDTANKTVVKNGEAAQPVDVFSKDGKTYIDEEGMKIFDMELYSFSYRFVEKDYEYHFDSTLYDDDYYYDWGGPDYEEDWEVSTDSVINEDGKIYIPFRDMINCGLPEDAYIMTYDSGKIFFRNEGRFGELYIDVNARAAYKNGELTDADVFLRNGRTYISSEGVRELFGMDLNYIEYYLYDKSFICRFYATEEEGEEEVWPFSLAANFTVIEEDGDKVYLPLREILESDGDRIVISYDSGKVTLGDSVTGDQTVIDIADRSYVKNGGNRTYADVKLTDGKTFIESNTVCNIFDVSVEWIEQDLISGNYNCFFSSNEPEED